MKERLEIIQERYDNLNLELLKPEVYNDYKKMQAISKEKNSIEPIVQTYKKYNTILDDIEAAKEMSKDPDMKEFALAEIDNLHNEKENLESKLKIMLLPKDPNDEKNVIIEIRGAAGGDEANIFAGDLFRMYTKYCESKGWRTSVVDVNEGTSGGYKEVIFEVTGEDVYGTLKFEAGVHRVQRVPQTETQGRVHTSAATVMVLPEAEEFDVQIDMNDVRIDFFCSSGPGGQSVNTTKSAVRMTHIPTGLVAQCQDEKSQHKNKDKALSVLRSRLYEMELAKKQEEDAKKRNSQVSSGDRSAKIRTYNYPQGRVTDHRIGLTIYDLDGVMNGNIQKIIDELQLVANTEKLKESEVF